MKTLLLKFLGITLLFTAFLACSNDDDDDPIPVINDIMVVYDRSTGVFSAINKADGALTTLGSITMNGEVLIGLRDVVYNPNNSTIYATSNSNSPADGKIYSINPATLVATVLNDNANEDWYAVPGIEMSNGKLLGTVYWDEYNYEEYSGLVWLNLDGTVFDRKYFTYQGDDYNICCGMGLEFGANSNEILMSYEREIVISDLNGLISEVIELTETGFPMDGRFGGSNELGYVRCIEKDANGTLYGLDEYGAFGTINLETGTFNYITRLSPEDGNWLALSKIPANVF